MLEMVVIASVASVLNEIGVVVWMSKWHWQRRILEGLGSWETCKANMRSFYWRNISEFRFQAKGIERAVCIAKEGIYTNWLAFEEHCQCRIAWTFDRICVSYFWLFFLTFFYWISKQLELEAGENGCLAVLHNRNDMSGALNSSDWVVNSKGRVISRRFTSCAGMTAQHVLLAQTKIGFLTGGRGYSFQELSPEEKLSQREEAFARRATVALTRAQRFCFIMCPLDMKGIIGAATVVGCLQHGAGVCDEQSTGSSLLVELKASSLASSREDGNFLAALRHSATIKTGEFPPAALVELYHEPGAVPARLRRLHLMIVDLCHPRKTVTKIEKKKFQQITRVRDTEAVSITPIPLWNHEEWRCRYVFGYSLDDSDKPVFLVWPERTENNGLWLLDVDRDYYLNLCQVPSIQNLGLEHFYAAFGLGCSRNLRTSSARAFGIKEDDISEDCSVASAIAHRLQPLQHGIPCETHVQKKAKTTPPELEVQQVEEQVAASSPNCSDSEASSSSQSSSTAEAEDVESDLEDLEEHYYSNLRRYSAFLDRDRPRHYTTQQLNAQEWAFSGGRDGLERFFSRSPPRGHLPDSCFPYETWWSKWRPYFKPIVLK